MQISTTKNEIIITNPKDFNIVQTLNCGQIFRYKIDGNNAVVYSQNKKCNILFDNNKILIQTQDVDYFYNFFDLNTNYSLIKNELKKDEFLNPAVKYGYGIRIIKNDVFEMIISFIISANNNIKRIKNSIEYLCTHFGSNMGEYYAFPTLEQLKQATVQNYVDAGLGYRSTQMFETVQYLTHEFLKELKFSSSDTQLKMLTSLKGVGEKVANCIMLFGLDVKTSFPVDTWINKVYNNLTKTQTNDRKKITKELTARYGELSGYAQQYFFYYYRENKIK